MINDPVKKEIRKVSPIFVQVHFWSSQVGACGRVPRQKSAVTPSVWCLRMPNFLEFARYDNVEEI